MLPLISKSRSTGSEARLPMESPMSGEKGTNGGSAILRQAEMDPRLLGTWDVDSTDEETIRRHGKTRMIFRPDGTLAYMDRDPQSGKSSVIALIYRTEGDVIITDQPSAPRQERIRYDFTRDGKLELPGPQGAARFVRISAEYPMFQEEAEFRKRIEASRPTREEAARLAETPSRGLWNQVWGDVGQVREFRIPGSYRTAYPSNWTQAYHDDGSPYFMGPRADSLVLRITTWILQKKGMLSRAPKGEEIVVDTAKRMPGARLIQLHGKAAAYRTEKGDGEGYESHFWVLGHGPVVLHATGTIAAEVAPSTSGREDLEIATKILSSIVFDE